MSAESRLISRSFSDIEEDDVESMRCELTYRRGCDQTANHILWYVEQLADKKEIVRALHVWTDVLGEMRHDGQVHLMLLDEASRRVTERLQKCRWESGTDEATS